MPSPPPQGGAPAQRLKQLRQEAQDATLAERLRTRDGRSHRGEGGYMAKPRRRRASGSLGSLKSALWATITYNLAVIEDDELDHEVKQRACNSLTQAALAFAKVIELYEQQKQMDTLERLAGGNGHLR